jgi:hypothetical protein
LSKWLLIGKSNFDLLERNISQSQIIMLKQLRIMEKIETLARAQLSVIKIVNEIRIRNKDEIVRLIAEGVKETRQVLLICTSIIVFNTTFLN